MKIRRRRTALALDRDLATIVDRIATLRGNEDTVEERPASEDESFQPAVRSDDADHAATPEEHISASQPTNT